MTTIGQKWPKLSTIWPESVAWFAGVLTCSMHGEATFRLLDASDMMGLSRVAGIARLR